MKLIPLTKGQFAQVDDEDYDFLMQWKWCFCDGYAVKGGKNKLIRMHKLINKTPDGYVTDHRDRNKLNNQKYNLRTATQAQNTLNRKANIGSSSKFKGVSFFKRVNKWRARMRINKKDISLGYFFSEIDAAIAYNNAAIKYHGDFAKLNTFET